MEDFKGVQKRYNERIRKAENDYKKSFEDSCTDISNELRKFRKVVNDNWADVRKYLRDSCKCFSWKDGTIEDMVISLLRLEMLERPCAEVSPKKYKYDKELLLKEKTKAVDELNCQNVDLPYGRWKMRRSLREDKESKLFLSPKNSPRKYCRKSGNSSQCV